MAPTATRLYGAALAGLGAVTVVRGPGLVSARGGVLTSAMRALGVRQIVQGAGLVARPESGTVRLSLAADALHLTTLLPLLLVPRWRRFAVLSGVTTGVFVAAGALLAD